MGYYEEEIQKRLDIRQELRDKDVRGQDQDIRYLLNQVERLTEIHRGCEVLRFERTEATQQRDAAEANAQRKLERLQIADDLLAKAEAQLAAAEKVCEAAERLGQIGSLPALESALTDWRRTKEG